MAVVEDVGDHTTNVECINRPLTRRPMGKGDCNKELLRILGSTTVPTKRPDGVEQRGSFAGFHTTRSHALAPSLIPSLIPQQTWGTALPSCSSLPLLRSIASSGRTAATGKSTRSALPPSYLQSAVCSV